MARILTVDDEPGIHDLLSIMLKKGGHETVKALSGEEALQKLKEEKVDAVLLDVMMPGMDGWDTLKKIRENPDTRDIPVIMLTVRGEEEDRERSFEYRADAHLTKPIIKEQLLKTVEWVLTQAKRRGMSR